MSDRALMCVCDGDVPHRFDPGDSCPPDRVRPTEAASARGTWGDPAITDDSRIDHGDQLVRDAAELLHRNESMHLHWYISAPICPYCALRATHVVRLARRTLEPTPKEDA